MIEKRIKELRIKNGLTQKELAMFLGLTPKMISFYELGQRTPPSDIILKLAEKFKVSTDYLLGREEITQQHHDPKIAKLLKDNNIEKLEVTKDISIEELKKIVEFYHTIKINKE